MRKSGAPAPPAPWDSSTVVGLNGEALLYESFALTDLGGNVCSCHGKTTSCQVLSIGLTAPHPM